MASGIYFPIAALGFSLLTIITFYVKKPIKSVETKIYKYLMICNFIGLILELNCTFASYISNTFPQTSDFILKTYLVYNLIWTLILTIYVLYISIDTGISNFSLIARMTGTTRPISSSSEINVYPRRVDSPPTSIIVAPSFIISSVWASAASRLLNFPPSEKESGVTFNIPIT